MNVYFYRGEDGNVWFHLDSPSPAGPPALPFEFDGPATEQHKKEYSGHYEAFLASEKLEKEEVSQEELTAQYEAKKALEVKPEEQVDPVVPQISEEKSVDGV